MLFSDNWVCCAGLICCATNGEKIPQMLRNKWGKAPEVDEAAGKLDIFPRFSSIYWSVFCTVVFYIHIGSLFLKVRGPRMPLAVTRTP